MCRTSEEGNLSAKFEVTISIQSNICLILPVVPLVYKISARSSPNPKDMKNKWWEKTASENWYRDILLHPFLKAENVIFLLDLSTFSRKILSASIYPFCECPFLLFSEELLGTGRIWKKLRRGFIGNALH